MSAPRRALPLVLALVLLAGAAEAQVIMRPPGQGPPTLPRSPGQLPRPPGTTDPDGPYSLARRFHPKPAGHEVVTLPLRPGKNELVLAVQGRTASGETTASTDRLEFEVR